MGILVFSFSRGKLFSRGTFIVLLSTLFSGASLGSGDPHSALGLFTEPRARSLTMMTVVFGADLPFVTQPVTVKTLVGEDGRVIDYNSDG